MLANAYCASCRSFSALAIKLGTSGRQVGFIAALLCGGAEAAAATATNIIDTNTAERFARLALDCVQREYPNKIAHVMNSAADAGTPSALYPVFYGCFDWHSAVHGHWLLVRQLRTAQELPPEMQDAVGDYDAYYGALLAPHGIELRPYFVVDMEFPDSVDEAEGWLILVGVLVLDGLVYSLLQPGFVVVPVGAVLVLAFALSRRRHLGAPRVGWSPAGWSTKSSKPRRSTRRCRTWRSTGS